MSKRELTELEIIEEKRQLAQISGTPRHIEINERTLEAYRKAFADKGLVIESKNYPDKEFHLVKKQKKFDSIVDASKPIQKKIWAMVRQPVIIRHKDGKTVTKDALYYYGHYTGVDKAGTDIAAEFHEGWYLRPKLQFQLKDSTHPYDSVTGEKRGKYAPGGSIYEHYIFLPENKEDRIKFLNDLMKNSPGTTPENLAFGGHLSYRQTNPDNHHSTNHGGSFDWQTFCELSLRELGEIQQTGYYKEEKTCQLKDSKGRRVSYDASTNKVQPLKDR